MTGVSKDDATEVRKHLAGWAQTLRWQTTAFKYSVFGNLGTENMSSWWTSKTT